MYKYTSMEVLMKYDPVPVPDRTVQVKTKSGTYIYLTVQVKYHSDLRTSRPERIAIGKLNEEGLLVPNRNYFEHFGESLTLPSERADYVSTGPKMVVDKISDRLELKELLDDVFGDSADKILDVATYMVFSENNVMHYFEDYGYGHHLFNGEMFSDTTVTEMMKSLKVKDMDLFIRAWVKMHVGKKIYVAYDSTNMNSTAGNIDLVEYGHAKDDEELPQVNVSLGYNRTDGIPLFYELYPGSIIDNSECRKMVERANSYGCKEIGFILDRGYFSKENIRYFERNRYDYILMTKGNVSFIQEAIEEVGAVLKNGYSGYIKAHEIYGTTIEKELFTTGKKQYVHIYYNGMEAEKEKIEINNRFIRIDEELNEKRENKLKRKEDVKGYEKYYRLKFDENGYFLTYQRKEKEIRKLIDKAGYFAIITSEKMSAEEALDIYKDRDAVEKIFRMEKSYLGNDVFRVHSTSSLESKVFISFIALIIRNEIYKSVKELYKKNRSEYTVPKVLREYERIGITKLGDDKYHLRYLLTAKQKKLLKQLDITENEYEEYTKNVIHILNP